MRKEKSGMNRREFLKQGAIGLGALTSPSLTGLSWAASKDRVTIYHGSGMDSLHPYNHSSSPLYGLWEHIMEDLVDIDYTTNQWAGRLAESWEFQGRKWVFKLRKGVRFHDGSPFTSKDVIFSYNRIKNDKLSLQKSNFADVVEMAAPDDHTLVLVTKEPNVVLLDRLQNRVIISSAAAEKYGDDLDKHPIGTGPYKFVSFKRDGEFVVRRNDDYWGPKAEIREVVWRKVTEEAARIAALEAGQADVIYSVPIHEALRLERHPRVRVEKVAGLRMYFIALNPAFKPFDNKLVRQAVNYSIDTDALIKNIFDGNGFALNGPVGPNVIGHDPSLKRYPYDPKKAKELLAKAGYPSGAEIKFYYSPGRYPKDKEVCQAIANQLTKGGFKVDLIAQEWAIFWGLSGVNGGKLPMYYIGRGSLTDADTLYDQYFRTGTTKRVSYSNPEFDKLIDEEQKTGDHKKRLALLQKASKILMEDVPFVPLYDLADIYGVVRNVIWKPRPDEQILAFEMKIRA